MKRTYAHNLKLAVLLSLTAGFVKAAGFLGFSALTTNVTGHAALFAEGIARQDWSMARLVATWIILFLAGAFTSSLIVTKIGHNARFSFGIPIVLETLILLFCAFSPWIKYWVFSGNFFAGSLLFAMGMQNALVSVISGSVVRTTHLTGTFTDSGVAMIISSGFWTKVGAKSNLKNQHSSLILKTDFTPIYDTGAVLFQYFRNQITQFLSRYFLGLNISLLSDRFFSIWK